MKAMQSMGSMNSSGMDSAGGSNQGQMKGQSGSGSMKGDQMGSGSSGSQPMQPMGR
jgi:hypothetical protein